ncbi:ABC transporter ATP-binding protein [Luteimonas sp. MJ174]|uniref:ABC transporter ATP-binding protein n=1 Tax=Luteimonas sp. MJ174 TaxID=3129237 RepID=UPI0031BB64E7
MIETLRKTWALFAPSERRKALLILALVVLMAIAETVSVVSIMPFLSVLGRPEVVNEHHLLHQVYTWTGLGNIRTFIIALGLASMIVVVLSSAFKTVTLHLVNRFIHFQRHSLSSRLLSTYLHQPYEFFLTRNSSALSKNVLSEVDQLTFELLQPLSQLIAQGAVVLAMLLLVFIYDPWVALSIVLAVTFLYGVIYLMVRRRLGHIGRDRQSANTQRYQACNEALVGIKDVKVTHSEGAYLDTFSRASREFSRHSATSETLSHSPLYLVEAAGYSGLIAIALYLLLRSNDMAQVLPALGLYGFAAYRLLPAAQIMYRGFARLRFSSAPLQNIHHDITLPADRPSTNTAVLPMQREIRLQGIRYSYPSAPDKPTLDGLDLVIPANTSVGIAGRSGAGKSTLMDILLGLLEPQAGTFSVDGVEIIRDNLAAWQKSIGYVPQHIYLADASVAENIAFGVRRDDIDLRGVERAARAAQIHDFIVSELPQGYDTTVGDRGIRLSGGQRQRVGIARALYRDPPVLLMDEATSALDAQTEEAVNTAISNLSGSKTIVVIAHRTLSLQSCEKVIDLSLSAPSATVGHASAENGGPK